MKSFRLHLWSECLSPMTHLSGSEGNVGMCATEPVDTPTGRRWVPYLSANAIRHRLVREPGANYLVEALGLKGKLTLETFNFLLHGGNLTGSTGREDVSLIAEMQEVLPLVRLVGGALPNQMLSGSLRAWRGLLACRENARHLPANLPDGWEIAGPMKPATDYLADQQYTRGDGSRRTDDYDPASYDPDAKTNLMIVSMQTVIRGACYSHGFDLPRCSDLELGCLLHSLGRWAGSDPTIGGMAAKGHGRLRTSILSGEPIPVADLVAGYTDHVERHADRCRAWIDRAFKKTKEEKPARGKGKKKPAEEPTDG